MALPVIHLCGGAFVTLARHLGLYFEVIEAYSFPTRCVQILERGLAIVFFNYEDSIQRFRVYWYKFLF